MTGSVQWRLPDCVSCSCIVLLNHSEVVLHRPKRVTTSDGAKSWPIVQVFQCIVFNELSISALPELKKGGTIVVRNTRTQCHTDRQTPGQPSPAILLLLVCLLLLRLALPNLLQLFFGNLHIGAITQKQQAAQHQCECTEKK